MNATGASRPLHLHTLESLCADLVSGRPILVGTTEEELVLVDPASLPRS